MPYTKLSLYSCRMYHFPVILRLTFLRGSYLRGGRQCIGQTVSNLIRDQDRLTKSSLSLNFNAFRRLGWTTLLEAANIILFHYDSTVERGEYTFVLLRQHCRRRLTYFCSTSIALVSTGSENPIKFTDRAHRTNIPIPWWSVLTW